MNISKVIKKYGKTIQDVADAMGKSRSTIANTIANNPTIDTLRKIADVLGCDVVEFFDDERTQEPPYITCPNCGKKIIIKTEIR